MGLISKSNAEKKYICPVCGYDKLLEEPYDKDKNPSYEICPCCGFEFGFDDEDQGHTFEEYREKWIENGMEWFDKSKKPLNWDFKKQMQNIYPIRNVKIKQCDYLHFLFAIMASLMNLFEKIEKR
ncbi:transcription elongation factor Elf1 [Methanococcus maripaludis]|uniref:Transcription elongation factor Elf1 n=1 Tax=Methanococcus maripaludis TaxID=39152 RepID=A0A7J9S7P9_METMI|nr:hypothetical protein [Methanococcus maripaludis]MBB6401913.1 transcription elongation factor Elf1 [Methanococcus maripaludis]